MEATTVGQGCPISPQLFLLIIIFFIIIQLSFWIHLLLLLLFNCDFFLWKILFLKQCFKIFICCQVCTNKRLTKRKKESKARLMDAMKEGSLSMNHTLLYTLASQKEHKHHITGEVSLFYYSLISI